MSSKVTLTGHFTLLDGTPAVGTVLIRPSRSPILDLDGKTVISGPQRFQLDAEGRFSLDLPPTDDPALGEPFTYHVMVTMDHTNWQVIGLTLPAEMISVDVLDPPAGVVKEYPTRAEWDALTAVVVAEMESALAGAESARDTTVSARDTTVVARDETLTARDTAVGAAGEADTARTETLTARDATFTARDITVEARGETLDARDVTVEARDTTLTALPTALAGKVTGQGMTLRYDKTVGERVFLDHPGGSTMLYGDTGWRAIPAPFLATGTLLLRRINNTVFANMGAGRYRLFTWDENTTRASLVPKGFRPDGTEFMTTRLDVGKAITGIAEIDSRGNVSPRITNAAGSQQAETALYATIDAWPTTLPGTPL